MRKQNRQLLWFSVILAGLFLLWCSYLIQSRGESAQSRMISIVVYDSDKERWESLRQGAETAAASRDAEIRLVTISNELNWQEQIQLFERELRNGTDCFLIAAADSEEMDRFLTENRFPFPYQMIETGGSASENPVVEVDNYKMGYELAEQLLEQEKPTTKLAVILENEQRESVEKRIQGFLDAISQSQMEVVRWERTSGEEGIQTKRLLQKMLTQEAVDLVVAFDNSTFEAAVDAITNLNKECGIYGVGNSEQAVAALDSNLCKALAYQDEFSIGYLGVCQLLEKSKETVQPQYRIVTRENMYRAENEKLIFPFVK